MSSQQQALVMETLISIRKTLKRKVYDSDSDSPIEHNTNRGNKLKRRSRFVRQGHLETTGGPTAYKEFAEHSGYQRAIISRNPPLVDDEGYDLDSDDDDEHIQEVETAAAEENPYSAIHLEQIFAPLTTITDLPTHPILSRPFTSTALDELAKQACTLTHKENLVLRKVRPLQTKLHGDHTWAPCGIMVGPNDEDLFIDTERFFQQAINGGSIAAATTATLNGEGRQETRNDATVDGGSQPHDGPKKQAEVPAPDVQLQDPDADKQGEKPGEANGTPAKNGVNGDEKTAADTEHKNGTQQHPSNKPEGGSAKQRTNGASGGVEGAKDAEDQDKGKEKQLVGGSDGDVEMIDSSRPQGIGAREDIYIHPMFVTPLSARPDRDLGLPEQESEDIRRLLQLYVQKQEEICRGTKRLYDGLLKADRYRKTVLKWAKAEAHCGPNRELSDGEDWYDKEEWGLTEDLKKGQDEEEEDTAQTQKKTRNRK
ncbi:hypothetical protein GQ53DRAFT_712584 [Thozetella sp. PMI_491]|nr:hypothetical protein GQ53DRAFT_712584 [Thozetella sp. PMI_491]